MPDPIIYETVIGLEVHVQLNTRTKAFCGCANEFGTRENTRICPVCLGLPGSLPVLNGQALRRSVKVALAFGCTVRDWIKFDRKNYFYPDLPKNFQISQYDMPLSENGFLDIEADGRTKRIGIKRIHLEEDAGKLVHPEAAESSWVDFNRAGTPLLEIVSDPDISSPQEAYAYLSDLKLTLKYLDISDCDMEKGSLRCDANISIRPVGQKTLGVKTELKNMNSFKAVKAGLEYEIGRQAQVLAQGGKITQETRLWDEKTQKTQPMRSKEEAHDYRYFPEPDLPPFTFTAEEVDAIRRELPELPQARRRRFQESFQFSAKESAVLIADRKLADFFEACLKLIPDPKKVANWLAGPVSFEMNRRNAGIDDLGLAPERLAGLLALVDDGTVSQLAAKDVLTAMLDTRQDPREIVKEKNLGQVSDAQALGAVVEAVVAENPKSVEDYLAGKDNALMFLVGQVMKRSQGKANPKVAKELLAERLKR